DPDCSKSAARANLSTARISPEANLTAATGRSNSPGPFPFFPNAARRLPSGAYRRNWPSLASATKNPPSGSSVAEIATLMTSADSSRVTGSAHATTSSSLTGDADSGVEVLHAVARMARAQAPSVPAAVSGFEARGVLRVEVRMSNDSLAGEGWRKHVLPGPWAPWFRIVRRETSIRWMCDAPRVIPVGARAQGCCRRAGAGWGAGRRTGQCGGAVIFSPRA